MERVNRVFMRGILAEDPFRLQPENHDERSLSLPLLSALPETFHACRTATRRTGKE